MDLNIFEGGPVGFAHCWMCSLKERGEAGRVKSHL